MVWTNPSKRAKTPTACQGNDFGSDFCGLVMGFGGGVGRGEASGSRRRDPVDLVAGFNGDDFAVGRAAEPLETGVPRPGKNLSRVGGALLGGVDGREGDDVR